MENIANRISVFVKPWKGMSLAALAAHVHDLGFDAVELPVRPGFPCRPETVEDDLPQAVTILADHGVSVLNVTADLPLDDERLYAACARAGVPMNRVMFRLGEQNYWEAEAAARRQLDAALPLCAQYGVQIGVQNHVNKFVAVHEMGLHHLVHEYNSQHVAIIWDAAHNALAGMEPEPALDVVSSHLCMVNLKNGFWQRTNGPEADVAEWKVYWTSGRQGLASWPRVIAKIKQMNYTGPICLTAEYSDHDRVDSFIAADVRFARSLLESA
ncbi:TIM barrel protein [bacterium]|nr:TIM barrel protein [bacterium]